MIRGRDDTDETLTRSATLLCVFLARFVLVLAVLATLRSSAAEDLAERVVIVANRADPDSLRIARHYAEVRKIPAENIVSATMPTMETISWDEFVVTVWNPLRAELVAARWIDATPMDLEDEAGRKKYAIANHRIAYLVVCRGVPLRIRHDPKLYKAARPHSDNAIFRTNAAAVDGELSLLAYANHEINAYLPNPLFDYERVPRGLFNRVIKVSRLDGPTVDDALGLAERAVAAELSGVRGRAYVDIGGIHPDGDRWLENVAQQLEHMGFDHDVDREKTTIPATARFDSPVLYFGWYAATVNGPFAVPGFRFPAGAVALHIHSYSATTLRNPDSGWSGPLVARGVTATVGNVFEPYLQLTHRPDLLLRALLRGETFGDAACYAQPALSWHTIAIGDPLYRPFPVSAER